eukprot:Transcript_1863.p1 GENE.Transcript_1863~~Transcript_1863.p1  ORF type:complete len:812 (-),score=186.79 Transcript_1863:79-2514(-)
MLTLLAVSCALPLDDQRDVVLEASRLNRIIAAADEPCRKLDLVLVLDESNSPTKVDNMKLFGKEIIKAFGGLGDEHAKIGVVAFDNNAYLRTGLTSDIHAVNGAMDTLSPQDWTSLSAGMLMAGEQFVKNGRPDAVRAVLILSDGEHNSSECDHKGYTGSGPPNADGTPWDPWATLEGRCQNASIAAADHLKDIGVHVFAWGFGDAKLETLQQMASAPAHAQYSSGIFGLMTSTDDMRKEACYDKLPPPKPPSAPPGAPPPTWPALPPYLPGAVSYADEKTANSALTVHGDPMAKVGERKGTHLWIVSGILTPLLQWKSPEGTVMQLHGKTFDRPETGSQWFDQLVLKSDGTTVLDVTALLSGSSTVKMLLDGQAVSNREDGATMNADAVCKSQPTPNRPGHACFASTRHPVVVLASKRAEREHAIGGQKADTLDVAAGGVQISIYTAKATKFASKAAQARYMHLNFQIRAGLPKGATGLFAEIAGVQPMSAATRALLKNTPHRPSRSTHDQHAGTTSATTVSSSRSSHVLVPWGQHEKRAAEAPAPAVAASRRAAEAPAPAVAASRRAAEAPAPAAAASRKAGGAFHPAPVAAPAVASAPAEAAAPAVSAAPRKAGVAFHPAPVAGPALVAAPAATAAEASMPAAADYEAKLAEKDAEIAELKRAAGRAVASALGLPSTRSASAPAPASGAPSASEHNHTHVVESLRSRIAALEASWDRAEAKAEQLGEEKPPADKSQATETARLAAEKEEAEKRAALSAAEQRMVAAEAAVQAAKDKAAHMLKKPLKGVALVDAAELTLGSMLFGSDSD